MQLHTVTEVNSYLREVLESDPHLGDIWITGEVSNLSRPASGHVYFTLKDDQCQLKCVQFRRAVNGSPAFENGSMVVAHGRLSIYEASGQLQLYVEFVQPEGVGELYLEFQRLFAVLEAEGLFEAARKRQLPLFPHRIAIITSPTGAVFHDICNVLTRRWPLVEVVLIPTAVQGVEAVPGVLSAFDDLKSARDIDVVIVARGGGSIEDLAAFNHELVARAIFACHIPVVSAVGHQTDTTIADFVADVRAPTPSVAAELCVPDQRDLRSRILSLSDALSAEVDLTVRRSRDDLKQTTQWLERRRPDLDRPRQAVDDRLRRAVVALERGMERSRGYVSRNEARLAALSPLETLGRGYAVVQRTSTGEVVTRAKQVEPGDKLRIRVSDGDIAAQTGGGSPSPRKARRGTPNGQLALAIEDVAQR